MKFSRIPILLAATALTVTACNRDAENLSQAGANPLLSHVPADSPYVFANIEPTPPEVIDAFMLRFAPTLATAQALLDDFKLEINTENPDEHREARLVSAILSEFDGKLNREGLESMGLSLESHKVIYGMGMFPVVRVALKDAEALRATIGRIETASGMTFTSLSSGDAEYWRITGHNGGDAGVYIAILADHAAFSMFPTTAEADLLPSLLGQATPANTMSSETLMAMNREKGYSNFGSGFLDLQRVAGEILDDNSQTITHLKKVGHYKAHGLDEVCTSEIKSMVARVPRITGGTTELTPNTVAVSYELEIETTLAEKLAGLVADVAVADSSTDKVFSAAMGLRMGRVRDLAIERANAIVSEPFQCEKLRGMNVQAQAMLDQLNRPMPPFVNNLKGFRVSMDEVDFENFKPENSRGMFSLEVEKPQMLIGMAQMFVPSLDGLQLEPGAEPVELPQELMSFSSGDLKVFAAMGTDSVGFAVGGDQQAELAAFMDTDADNDGTFFSVDYDMAAPVEFQRKLQRQFADLAEGGNDEWQDLVENIQDSYMNWLGRSRVEVGFNSEGLQIETKMTFK